MSKFIALMYHSLGEPPKGHYSIRFSEFKAQLDWLRGEGFVIDGFRELERRLVRNEFPERYVVMTFDDGHKSDLRAAEMLRQVDAQATFFLIKDYARNRRSFLSESEIKELSTLCSIGSHGLTHSSLVDVSVDQAIWELAESKKWLEDLLGTVIDKFSAPGGHLSSVIVRRAFELGYCLLGNSTEWYNRSKQVKAKKLVNRIPVRSSFRMPLFAKVVRSATPFLLGRQLRSKLLYIPKKLLTQAQIERLRGITFN